MNFNPGNSTGIVDEVLKITKATTGKYPLVDIARRVNAGLVRAFQIGFQITGDVSLDDVLKSAPPIGYQNIASGTNAYAVSGFSGTFTNFVKLEVLDNAGNSKELQEEFLVELNFTDLYSASKTGVPSYFVKVGATYYLRPTPNYNYTNGLIGFGNRKANFFVSTDTAVAQPLWLPEFYLARYAAQPYLEENGMQNAQSNYQHILEDEQEIRNYFIRISKNTRPRMSALSQDNR